MPYLYHGVPKNMEGNILYPLNTLKVSHPHLYESITPKYKDREWVMDYKVLPLNCLWNDVIQLIALHPQVVADAFTKLGRPIHGKYYQFDAKLFEPEKTTVYLNKKRAKAVPLAPTDFASWVPEEAEKFAYLPDEAIEYFKTMIDKGEPAMMYHLVPHIFYKGTLDVTNIPIIEV